MRVSTDGANLVVEFLGALDDVFGEEILSEVDQRRILEKGGDLSMRERDNGKHVRERGDTMRLSVTAEEEEVK